MATTTTSDGMDLGEDMEIRRPTRQPGTGANGMWVEGSLNGHRFQALVFAEHADNPEWEVGGDSRISKLWLQRMRDNAVVFNWDRGQDLPPTDSTVAAIVDFLCAGLAEHTFPT